MDIERLAGHLDDARRHGREVERLTLDAPEPDRITTSEKKPLKVDFIAYWRIVDVRKYYQSVTGDEELAKQRLAQTIRAILGQEINKRTIHEAISTERDKIMTTTRTKADADAKTIGVIVLALFYVFRTYGRR